MAQPSTVSRREVGVRNALGLHLRVANILAKLANTFQSEIQVQCNGITANGKSILSLLGLAAECGAVLLFEAQGVDADAAVSALESLMNEQEAAPAEPLSSATESCDNPCLPLQSTNPD